MRWVFFFSEAVVGEFIYEKNWQVSGGWVVKET